MTDVMMKIADETAQSLLSNWMVEVIDGKNPFDSIPENKIQEIYRMAYALYQQKNYLTASYFFRLLCTARPADPNFWKGLGGTLQMQKNYEEALNCYLSSSLLCNQDSPDPALYAYAADCYFAINQTAEGIQALKAAEAAAKKTNNESVLRHVNVMLQQWLTHSNELKG
jgi:type III secretion system low calcium response chaperone LcrH/SycD